MHHSAHRPVLVEMESPPPPSSAAEVPLIETEREELQRLREEREELQRLREEREELQRLRAEIAQNNAQRVSRIRHSLQGLAADESTTLSDLLPLLRFGDVGELEGKTNKTANTPSAPSLVSTSFFISGTAAPAALVHRSLIDDERAAASLSFLRQFIAPRYLSSSMHRLYDKEAVVWQALSDALHHLRLNPSVARLFAPMSAERVFDLQHAALVRFVYFINVVKRADRPALKLNCQGLGIPTFTPDLFVCNAGGVPGCVSDAERNSLFSSSEARAEAPMYFPGRLLQLEKQYGVGKVRMEHLELQETAGPEGVAVNGDRIDVVNSYHNRRHSFNSASATNDPDLLPFLRHFPAYIVLVSPLTSHIASNFLLSHFHAFLPLEDAVIPLAGGLNDDPNLAGLRQDLAAQHLSLLPRTFDWASGFAAAAKAADPQEDEHHCGEPRTGPPTPPSRPVKRPRLDRALQSNPDCAEAGSEPDGAGVRESADGSEAAVEAKVVCDADGATKSTSAVAGIDHLQAESAYTAAGAPGACRMGDEEAEMLSSARTLSVHFASSAPDHVLVRQTALTQLPSLTSIPSTASRKVACPSLSPVTEEPDALPLRLSMSPLGEGASAIVYRGRTLRDAPVALKYARTNADTQHLKEEEAIYSLLEAGRLDIAPRCFGLFRGGQPERTSVLVLELFGRSLRTLNELDYAERLDLYSLYDKLHSAGIVHNDEAERNILLDPTTRELKLIDFGRATRHDCPGTACEELDRVKAWLGIA
ncbi:hypothetical protein JCM10213_005551 [Rhodosporidiobolus nylandii]